MANEDEDTTKGRPNYNSSLCLCLLSSLGVCLAFLPYIPLSIVGKRDVIFILSRIVMILVIAAVEFLLIHFIRNKDRFHQAQLIFWPNRCRHCARVLGNMRSTSTDQSNNTPGDQAGVQVVGDTNLDALPIAIRHEANNRTERSCSSGRNGSKNFSGTSYFLTSGNSSISRPISASPLSPETSPYSSTSSYQPHCDPSLVDQDVTTRGHHCKRQHVYSKRHRSLVNVFNVFCLIALFGIPFLVINKLVCIVNSNGSMTKLITQEIYDVLLLSLIPVAMMFSMRYYDAIFVTTSRNCYSIVIFLSGGIWVSAMKLVMPISNLLGFDEMGSSCKMNSTYGKFLHYGERAMTPFYTECAIISTGILWQAWTSFVSRSELHLDREMPRYDAIPIAPNSRHWCQIFSSWLKSLVGKCRRSSGNGEEKIELISRDSTSGFERYIFKCWFVAISISIIYFTVSMWLIWDGYSLFPSKTTQQVYVGWSLEMLFYFPYFIFFYHISHLSRDRAHQPVSSQRSLEGHDILLLLCTCGIFCQTVFRITSGFGLLLSGRATSGDDYATWISSIIYSIFIIFLIFNLTSFLLRIQRHDPLNPTQVKWVLAFLIYISVLNSTEWLIDSIIVETWIVQCQFFGQTTGKVIGTLLDPFATLFGLHAAMVAHEAFKVILKRALEQQGRCSDTSSNTDLNN